MKSLVLGNEYIYFQMKHQFPADLHLQNAATCYIPNLIKLQAAAEPTPSTCCLLHILDI